MKCPYCGEELIISLYLICPKCKLAMTYLEYLIGLTSQECEK